MKCLNCEISVSGWRLGGMEVGLKLTRMEQTFYLPRYRAAATRCSAVLKEKKKIIKETKSFAIIHIMQKGWFIVGDI